MAALRKYDDETRERAVRMYQDRRREFPGESQLAARRPQVCPERGLAVGSGRDEVEPAARGELAGAVAGDEFSALVSEWLRGHSDEDVVGQQGHDRVEVSRLPRAGEPGHDRVLGG